MSSKTPIPTIFVDNDIPECLDWDCDRVADWIEEIGFPQYKECFRENFITGRHLILMEATRLPLIGIYNLIDILELTESIRMLLGVRKYDNEEVTAIPDVKILYLLRKSVTGKKSDSLTYAMFMKENRDYFDKFTD